jgi:hypothetical protein
MTKASHVWAVLAVCLIGSGCRQSESFHGVEIVGSERFVDQVRNALTLIRSQAPQDFEVIAASVQRVEEHDRSGMDASRSTCQLAPASAYASQTWCAGCIAHEAHHAKLSASPSYDYGEAAEERECIEYQRAVLERIAAPASELEHLATQDGSHFDANGDGEYTQEDYEARTW